MNQQLNALLKHETLKNEIPNIQCSSLAPLFQILKTNELQSCE